MDEGAKGMATGKVDADRRSVLKLLGVGSVGTVAVAVSGACAAGAEETKPAEAGGYRETEHVKTYYDRARF